MGREEERKGGEEAVSGAVDWRIEGVQLPVFSGRQRVRMPCFFFFFCLHMQAEAARIDTAH